jgi:hypothetical protein
MVNDPFDPETDRKLDEIAALRRKQSEQGSRNFLERRQQAYKRIFNGFDEDRKIVMGDLINFCRLSGTPWSENERVHCLLTGRHEVGSRILDHVNLTLDELVLKYSGE